MTLGELYRVSPWATIFVVQRESATDTHIKGQWEYKGTNDIAGRQVTRINATRYPMYASVLEVEIEY